MNTLIAIAGIALGIFIISKLIKLTLKAGFIIGCICVALYLCSQYGII